MTRGGGLTTRVRAWRSVVGLVLASTQYTISGMAQQPLAVPFSCAGLVDTAVDSGTAGRLDAAVLILLDATARCPAEPRVGRELAGMRFRQGRYATAAALAADYVARVPGDTLGWQLLATARYLTGDNDRALDAWNRVGLPRVRQLILNSSAEQRRSAFERVIGIPEHSVLTTARLQIARRRLNDLPSVDGASIHYQAHSSDSVLVRASVIERPVLDPWWRVAASTTARALGSQTARLELSNPAGWGERWQAEWRWEEARPRRALQLDIPVSKGVAGVEVAWERLRVAVDTGIHGVTEDTWQKAVGRYSWWSSPNFRPEFALGVESWNGARRYVQVSTRTEFRLMGDRVRTQVAALQATALHDHPSYRSAGLRAWWASSPGLRRATWSARLGADWVSADAPLGTWPLVNRSMDRAVPLRAEPAIEGSAMAARATGRAVLHGGLGADHPIGDVGPFTIALGIFLDAARVTSPAQSNVGDRHYLDGGGGVRVGLGRGALGVVRFDLAWGLLSEQRFGVSVGYHKEWPPWSRTSR